MFEERFELPKRPTHGVPSLGPGYQLLYTLDGTVLGLQQDDYPMIVVVLPTIDPGDSPAGAPDGPALNPEGFTAKLPGITGDAMGLYRSLLLD